MKIKMTKNVLSDGLQIVQNVVNIRSTLPILANVLVDAQKENKVYLTTTDLEVSVRCELEAEVSKAGQTTLPVRLLGGAVREFPEKAVELEVDEKDVGTLRCESSRMRIVGMSEEEFPPLPKAKGKYTYRMEQKSLREMLRRTAYAASTDETRRTLNGVLLSFHADKVLVVATDGRRLALVEQELECPKECETEAILPTKAVNELLHTLGDEGQVAISQAESQILFEFGKVLLASKLVDGQYPNFRQVIPAQCEERVPVERESLLTALRRVALVTTDKSNAVKLTFAKNNLTVSASTPDVGDADETIPVKYSGKEISVAFNPEFMMDPLRTLTSDEVFLEFTDNLSPGVIKADIPFLYVLMPMRLD
jgi:DNA polymerase-3 subunit beta